MKLKRNDEIAWRMIDGEALVVSPVEGQIYPLNRVAARIWEMADGSMTTAEIAARIEEEFDAAEDQIRMDVAAFVDSLLEKNLVTETT